MTPEELSDRLWRFAARVGKVVDVLDECEQLIKIVAKSVVTAKRKGRPRSGNLK